MIENEQYRFHTFWLIAVNGGWSVWSQWSLCSVSCGGGQHYRDRVCNNPSPANGGQLCSGQNRETQSCNEHACVVNGGFNVWSQWSFCSLTCGGGEHYRDRACNNPSPSNGGQLCSGPYRQIQSCNEHPCVVNGGWNVWSQWSLCSLTCGGGEHYRDRACNNPIPANGGQLCSGPYRQIQSCNEQPCVGGCLYKGHAYQEGHNWQDGCNYICACVDGNIGVYKCYPLCPTWNLPSVCIMEPPAPGRCCPQPKCPDNIRIDYPVGYQDH
ncbi:hypothetical protein ACJMK2_026614 [Sinanodonta woodiana]|uniref:VWFC domain-containing protein n=1 Tax=Sinanodonta woodiana TaxID=1069815 RepID=A0ABD3XNU9_SINWO